MRAREFLEDSFGTNPKRPARAGSRPSRGHEAQPRYKGAGISKDKENKFHVKLDKLVHNTFGPSSDEQNEAAVSVAGAIPTPSHQAAMYKAAADSNRAIAAQELERQRRDNAARAAKLAQNTQDVERLSKVSYHGADAPKPSNADWDGDSDFLDLDGTQYAKASRMPISGDVPPDMKLVVTKQGRQVYLWTRNSLKGNKGHYFYPAANPKTIQKESLEEHKKGVRAVKYSTKPKGAVNPSDAFAKKKEKAVAPKPAAKSPLAKVDKHLGEWGMCEHCGCEHELELDERGKASLKLCKSSIPDEDLGASQLASCKSQGLRARDGNKSHKLGKSSKSRVKVGGHKIKGKKYGGPLPDWS